MSEDGGPRATRTKAEQTFLTALLEGRPWLDVWLHQDNDGTPWACVSHDFSAAGAIQGTLRLDFDGREVLGGWSPGYLNWDDGVRALRAEVDVDGPDGLRLSGAPKMLAATAGDWFDRHREAWQGSLPPSGWTAAMCPADSRHWLQRRAGFVPEVVACHERLLKAVGALVVALEPDHVRAKES